MSDVFDVLLEKLEQKAFQYYELPQWILRRHEWVKLEDVKEAIQQIKQNYVLVSKEWLNKRLEEERQRTKFIDASDSHQAIGKIDLILEMLQRGSRGAVEE